MESYKYSEVYKIDLYFLDWMDIPWIHGTELVVLNENWTCRLVEKNLDREDIPNEDLDFIAFEPGMTDSEKKKHHEILENYFKSQGKLFNKNIKEIETNDDHLIGNMPV